MDSVKVGRHKKKKKVAFIFPGQGSQYAGMGRELAEEYPEAKAVFDLADRVIDFKVSEMCWGESDQLNQTRYTQPCVLTVELAYLEVLTSKGVKPQLAAGHSLGEYGALVAAGVLEPENALKIVRIRGQLTSDAAKLVSGGMAAVLGLDIETVERVVDSLQKAEEPVAIANINAPGQIVIAGTAEALEKAMELVKEKGAKRVVPLAVSGPFHTPLMKETAGKPFAAALAEYGFRNAEIPVISNATAKDYTSGVQLGDNLIIQLYRPVRWVECVELLSRKGAGVFVEVGPGKVLNGLVKKILPDAQVISVEGPEGIDGVIDFINEYTAGS